MDSKANHRLAIKERLKRMTENDRRVESQVIVRELKKLLGETPQTIGAYLPFLDEPDIRPLMSELLEKGWTLGIPKVERKNSMRFFKIERLKDVRKNPMTRISEPVDCSEPIDEAALSVILIPGRAFAEDGNRLGRGNGGYDRWIEEQRKRNPETRLIGVCFDCQLLSSLPKESHDQRVHTIITATKIVRQA